MQKIVYLDNAATSFPKAPTVAPAMTRYLTAVGGNLNRSAYTTQSDAEDTALNLREALCTFLGSTDVEACVFTPGVTYALNLILKGYLNPGDHVLVSTMEHNAVMRPLHAMAGVNVEKVPCAPDGSLSVTDVAARLRPETRLVCMTHASNVCGTLLPIADIGALCASRGVAFVVDTAQTAGHIPLNLTQCRADAFAIPAHKGLLGPQGIGAAVMTLRFAKQLRPLVEGGTGSRSDLETQPLELPDRFEAGTQNIPGIYGFLAGLDYAGPHMAENHAKAMLLCGALLEGAHRLPHARVLGKQGLDGRMPVVSLDFEKLDNALVADRLSREFGIITRCGLHCSPSAHHTLGSFPQGSVRFSIGAFNTADDIQAALDALRIIIADRHSFTQGSFTQTDT